MPRDQITFFYEGIHFRLPDEGRIKKWILSALKGHGQAAGEINYIFCDDAYLLKVNQEYLKHDYYTDIITFDMRDKGDINISADIFVSVQRVNENAKKIGEPFERELHRVIIHGMLHLIGYDDKKEEERLEMRQKEEELIKTLEYK